ncbi:hypothetical protein [Calidifontibacillus erzurumensis]|uniref:Uncharacterized protein n=1 Tax=Calidifontibacillus erzurumensis TaxID=2741433 RepID=A0A8J8K827_9BACI|nr:hypothetical protein [Calidifontibacillus erzurumensis]NSL51426.1 hypothetical protein [Calidifontibacillus erzurumensis]
MGYILPMNHEQYQQYANRVIRKDGSPFTVKRAQKVNLDAKLKNNPEFTEKYYAAKPVKNYAVKKREKTKQKIAQSTIQDVEAEITGKGQNFNDKV